MYFEDFLLDLAKRVIIFAIGGLFIMIALHIAHSDISHSIPALGYGACVSAACVISIGISAIKFLAEVG